MPMRSHWLWDHSVKDFAGMDMESAVALLPVAATEQHGPHLPVRVDAAINGGHGGGGRRTDAADLPVFVLPSA